MDDEQEINPRGIPRGSSFEQAGEEVTFFHDFIAGGVAGSISVIVGHPFDTMKVRIQTSPSKRSLISLATSNGGVVGSLYRGMAAPLSSACILNAMVFSTYGWSSRIYDDYIQTTEDSKKDFRGSSLKTFQCGSFAGFVQALVVCPMEHIKCRLQIQGTKGTPGHIYNGPLQATKSIVSSHGISGLYRGWWCTVWRESPAFGAYFLLYDICKDRFGNLFARQAEKQGQDNAETQNSHALFVSALAGGVTGATAWAAIYPLDTIKTKIQTTPLDTSVENRRISTMGRQIIQKHGVGHLYRGLNITMLRAFPVNGIIFPVYEYTLMYVTALECG
jgi:hypothetical protein